MQAAECHEAYRLTYRRSDLARVVRFDSVAPRRTAKGRSGHRADVAKARSERLAHPLF
jgi:hypothetical protein